MKRTFFLLSVFACAVLYFILETPVSACANADEPQGNNDPCPNSPVLDEMRSYYPVPISASPDGKLILARAQPEGSKGNRLVGLDCQNRGIIRTLKSFDPLIHD